MCPIKAPVRRSSTSPACPADAVAKLHAAAVKALATPQVRERFASLGVQPVGDTPEQFGAVIREDLARWSRVIKSAGVKVE
jgi:tripartite-type tricarboxylate transporter receptor subunit TctC